MGVARTPVREALLQLAAEELVQRLGVLHERGLHEPGVVLISGTIPMVPGVNQFAAEWRVELGDPATGHHRGRLPRAQAAGGDRLTKTVCERRGRPR